MIRPTWLEPLSRRDEALRAAHGLTPKKDGWYKSVDGRAVYIAKPMTVPKVAAVLEDRVKAIRAKRAGITLPVASAGLTLEGLAELYTAWLYERLTTGIPKKLARRTYDDIVPVVSNFVAIVGRDRIADTIGADDFSRYSKARFSKRAASSIRRDIIYIESFANWAAPGSRKSGHLLRPWQYGTDFRKPSEDEISTSAADSDKSLEPKALRGAFLCVKNSRMLTAAGWIALCAAMQPKDIGLLPESAVDLETGEIRFARGKTGVGRLAWLPPAARVAIRRYLESRPMTCRNAARGLLFRTSNGLPYYRDPEGDAAGQRYDGIGNRWHKVTGVPITALRSTFATIADDWPDQRAVDVVMGHKVGHTGRRVRSKHYAKRIPLERVQPLIASVVSRAFGRQSPAPKLVVPSAVQSSPPEKPSAPAATPQTKTPSRGSADASSQGAARRSRQAGRT